MQKVFFLLFFGHLSHLLQSNTKKNFLTFSDCQNYFFYNWTVLPGLLVAKLLYNSQYLSVCPNCFERSVIFSAGIWDRGLIFVVKIPLFNKIYSLKIMSVGLSVIKAIKDINICIQKVNSLASISDRCLFFVKISLIREQGLE